MKSTLPIIVLLGVAAVLFALNPKPAEFERYVEQRVEARFNEEGADSNRLGRLLTDMGSSVVGSLAARVSDRANYQLFSIYTVDIGGDGDPDEAWRFLGIAGQFIELSGPDSE
ncbi:MAG: DUF4359 domain-containing protein [Rhodothermales bacterium]|nr:DUF4359 domain-containing protein [Rhodothermales bacterium]